MSKLTPMFPLVAHMNEVFGNAKGNPLMINLKRLRSQMSNVAGGDDIAHKGEVKEFFHALANAESAQRQFVELCNIENPSAEQVAKTDAAMLDYVKSMEDVRDAMCDMLVFILGGFHFMGIDAEQEMNDVVAGVLTRTCANNDVLNATIKKYTDMGLEVYVEGTFPTMCVKSSKDQHDASGEHYPKGKFLKSTSYKQTVFKPLDFYVQENQREPRKFFGKN